MTMSASTVWPRSVGHIRQVSVRTQFSARIGEDPFTFLDQVVILPGNLLEKISGAEN